MDSWNLRTFRNDLSIFLKLITSEYPISGDFSSLWELSGKLFNNFSYSTNPIIFNIEGSISGSIPSKLHKHIIYFENSITINAYQIGIDPVNDYKFEINMNSFLEEEGELKCYKSAWHHDKNIDGETPKYTHPIYHFHYGGRYLKGLETGDISIMASPRLPHPPMDIFLGFHFIISNFISSKDNPVINELKGSYEYQSIIKRAQERLWTPYFRGYDLGSTHQDFTISNVFPLFIS